MQNNKWKYFGLAERVFLPDPIFETGIGELSVFSGYSFEISNVPKHQGVVVDKRDQGKKEGLRPSEGRGDPTAQKSEK